MTWFVVELDPATLNPSRLRTFSGTERETAEGVAEKIAQDEPDHVIAVARMVCFARVPQIIQPPVEWVEMHG